MIIAWYYKFLVVMWQHWPQTNVANRKINRRRVTSMQEIRSKISAETSNIFTDSQASLLLDPGLALATDDVDDDEDNHRRDEELL